jgi:6-pyruvoyltetrahydropterin/6-carboxytetrahydropterin synthase
MPDKDLQFRDPQRIGLRRAFKFEAGHVLEGYDGKCSEPHGHSYHGNVLVSAPRAGADALGIVVDFDILARAIHDCIFRPYDHTTLNVAAEKLVDRIAGDLQGWFNQWGGKDMAIQHEDKGLRTRHIPQGVTLERVVLFETANCSVVWQREGF